ncbi:mechanosensitive ion channel family protein [Aquiflexum lacus]|uniref:mechanosensitive ion channel family protein n=1 Tax=Aquiflexum lacus TaxID=2483805 RepID=UPI00189418D3|nr:mechanosensitive ion channel family protein [Aquiflexum lacus]
MRTHILTRSSIILVLVYIFLGLETKAAQNDSLTNTLQSSIQEKSGFPVLGVNGDTIFFVYSRLGASTPQERAQNISSKIKKIYNEESFSIDSLIIQEAENSIDLIYRDLIITSIVSSDATWQNMEIMELANELKTQISESILEAKEDQEFVKVLIRSLLVLLVLGIAALLYWLLGIGNTKVLNYLNTHKDKWLRNLAYKEYTFLTAEQELQMILLVLKIIRAFLYVLLFYFTLSIAFSIFPFTRGWADRLFQLVWSPFTSIFLAIWEYLPNLFTIVVIVFVMTYFIRLVKYIFKEIDAEKLHISGFHADWAMPTYSIVRFLLYAFMFVLVFPYLPGSDSNIFKGVSVFIGVLFSLGSSSAIANMVAGLVITYMRPFKIGDKIKIGDVTGDVMEKTLLVTRLRTPKNEEITIPNSAVLSGNTTNYSTLARTEGLIIHSTVTIGYDVPWKEVHQALIDAALRTEKILKEPLPFVLQTGLEDFYVSYQINAYTRESNLLPRVYSELHQNIQDSFFEKGIEILSPHYRAARDGNRSTIPDSYLPKDYQVPSFSIKMDKRDEK